MSMARSIVVFGVLLGFLVLTTSARGQEFPDPWEEYPAREVERPALPLEGGFEMDLLIESISTKRAFDDDGDVESIDDSYGVLSLDFLLGYGITDRWEVMLGVPYLTGEVGKASGGGLGDIYLGSRVGLYLTTALDLTLGLSISLPTGESDYHYELVNNQSRLRNFRTGDPGYNYYPELEARYRAGNWSVRLNFQSVITEKGEVAFNQSGSPHQDVDADPGDGYRFHAGAYYQVMDPLVAGLFCHYSAISETEIDGRGLDDESLLFEIEPRLLYQITPDTDLILSTRYAAFGKNEPAGYPLIFEVKSRF